MKLKQPSVKWVTDYSSKAINWKNELGKIDKFISKLSLSIVIGIKGYIKQRALVKKTITLFWHVSVNILGTGIILLYVTTHNNALSYGLISALILHYIEAITKIIKKNYNEDEE